MNPGPRAKRQSTPDGGERRSRLLGLAARIAAAYAARGDTTAAQVLPLIELVYATLAALDDGAPATGTAPRPAVPIDRSVTADYLVCLEDGRRLKMLKRYLRSRYRLTPAQYRMRWGLPGDYPMVAANYARRRSALAKRFGLGRKPARATR